PDPQAREEGIQHASGETVRACAADARSQAASQKRRHCIQPPRRLPEPRPFACGGILRAEAPDRRWVRRARADDWSARYPGRVPIYGARILRAGVRSTASRPRTGVAARRARRLAGRAVRGLPACPVATVSMEYPLAPSPPLLLVARGRFRCARREGDWFAGASFTAVTSSFEYNRWWRCVLAMCTAGRPSSTRARRRPRKGRKQ